MNNQNPLDKIDEQALSKTVSSKITEVIHLDEYVIKGNTSYRLDRGQAIENGQIKDHVTFMLRRFCCGHICNFDKTSWGQEITEPPRTGNKAVESLYKMHGYIIVCSECCRICSACGTTNTSTITGKQKDGLFYCYACYKKQKSKDFWEGFKNFFKSLLRNPLAGKDLW